MRLGFGARLTQNNGPNGLYQNQINTAAGEIHIALMGDPTLRLHIVAPPTQLRATTDGNVANLSWTASTDSVVGYHVYRMRATGGSFTRLTTSPVIGNTYIDPNAAGASNYMVRAVSLQVSPSGSYFNPSAGTFVTASSSVSVPPPIVLSASGSGNGMRLTWNSQAGTVYRVQARNLGAQGTWSDLSGAITASGSTTTWTDTNASSVAQRFYRIVGP